MRFIPYQLRHPHEFFWEPVRKRLHRTCQLRIERDYFSKMLDAAEQEAYRWEDLAAGRAAEVAALEKECQHELDLMERSWPEPRDGTTWLHCAACQEHVWTVPTRLLA